MAFNLVECQTCGRNHPAGARCYVWCRVFGQGHQDHLDHVDPMVYNTGDGERRVCRLCQALSNIRQAVYQLTPGTSIVRYIIEWLEHLWGFILQVNEYHAEVTRIQQRRRREPPV